MEKSNGRLTTSGQWSSCTPGRRINGTVSGSSTSVRRIPIRDRRLESIRQPVVTDLSVAPAP